MNKQLAIWVIAMILLIGSATAQTITSASELDYPPFAIVNPDGTAGGYSVELLTAALASVGYNVSFYVGPWGEIKEDLAQGRIQVLPLVGRTPEREPIYDFTVPYKTLYGAIFIRSEDSRIKGLNDLKDKEIVVMKGDNAEEFVRRIAVSEKIVTTTSFEEAFKLLSSGKHDAVITQKKMGEELLAKIGINNVKAVREIDSFKQDFTFGLKEGDKELLTKLNDGLSKIISDGTAKKIDDKWFGETDITIEDDTLEVLSQKADDGLEKKVLNQIKKAKSHFYELEEKDTKNIKSLLEDFIENREYKELFIEGNREKLFERSESLFVKNKNEQEVTHFYYHKADGTNFLRVHNKEIYDDKITRITFEKSKTSNSFGVGIELGKTAFALRVVSPYHYNDTLIGYVEFGSEIDHFLDELKGSTNNHFGIIVKKEYIDPQKWALVREVKNLRNNYNDMANYVYIESTDTTGIIFEGIQPTEQYIKDISRDGEIFKEIFIGEKTYFTGGFALYDAGGSKVGAVIVASDVTDFHRNTPISRMKISFIIMGLIGILIFIYFIFSIDNEEVTPQIRRLFSLIVYANIVIVFCYEYWMHTLNAEVGIYFLRGVFATVLLSNYFFMLLMFSIARISIKKVINILLIIVNTTLFFVIIFTKIFEEKAVFDPVRYEVIGTLTGIHGWFFPFWIVIVLFYLIIPLGFLIYVYFKNKEKKLEYLFLTLFGYIFAIVLSPIASIFEREFGINSTYPAFLSAILGTVILGFILFKLGYLKQKNNVTMAIMIASLFLITGLLVFNTYQTTESLKENAIGPLQESLKSTAKSRATHIESILAAHKKTMSLLTIDHHVIEFVDNKEGALESQVYPHLVELIANVRKVNEDILKVSLIDSGGKIIYSTDPSQIDLEKEEEFDVIKRDGIYIKDAHISKGFGVPCIDIGFPVYDHEGNQIGALIADISLVKIDTSLTERTGLMQSGETYLVNHDSFMITPSRFIDGTFLKTKIEGRIANDCLLNREQQDVMTFTDYRGIDVISSYASVPEMNWCLIAEIDEDEAFSEINNSISRMWYYTLFSIAVILLFGIIFNYFMTRSLRSQIHAKTHALTEFNVKLEDTVKDRTKELDDLTHNLEKKVEERTGELKTKLSELEDTKIAVMNMMDDADDTNRELLATQEDLKKMMGELKQMDTKKDEFISIAAHELKTPLTSIRGFAELLQKEAIAKDPSKRAKYFEIIVKDTTRLGTLITDILDLSRVDLGTLKLNVGEIKIPTLVKDLSDQMDIIIKGKGVKPIYDIAKNLPAIYADTHRLVQVLSNLIGNAVKYTDSGGSITTKIYATGGNMMFLVHDTGRGIPKGSLAHVFERFYQVDSSYTRSVGGTGLGLAICKELIESMGGTISVTSSVQGPSKGTTFIFNLPISKFKLTKKEMKAIKGPEKVVTKFAGRGK